MHSNGLDTLNMRPCAGTGSDTNNPRPAPVILDVTSVRGTAALMREGIALF
jgi:hypothetical protein